MKIQINEEKMDELLQYSSRRLPEEGAFLFTDLSNNETLKVSLEDESSKNKALEYHRLVYKRYPYVNVVAQYDTHWCRILSENGIRIPAISKLHAEWFCGEIPCVADLQDFCCTLVRKPEGMLAGFLVKNEGQITWGRTAEEAEKIAGIMERLAEDTYQGYPLNKGCFEYLPYALIQEYFDSNPENTHEILTATYNRELQKVKFLKQPGK